MTVVHVQLRQFTLNTLMQDRDEGSIFLRPN